MGTLYLIVAAILWGLIGPISKFLFTQGISPLETAFWRGNIAGIMYFLHWLKYRYALPRKSRDLIYIAIFGIIGVAGLEASFVYAVHYGGAALASILLYSAPIWVNLFSLIIWKEKISTKRWGALTLAFFGVVGLCISTTSVRFSLPAVLWGLGSGFSYALFYLAGRYFFRKHHPVVIFMIAFPVGSIGILPLILIVTNLTLKSSFTNIFTHSPTSIIACLFLGIVSTYIPYLLYGAGLQQVKPSRASVITMVEPIVSVALSAVIWGELFTSLGYLCAVLVLIGITLF